MKNLGVGPGPTPNLPYIPAMEDLVSLKRERAIREARRVDPSINWRGGFEALERYIERNAAPASIRRSQTAFRICRLDVRRGLRRA